MEVPFVAKLIFQNLGRTVEIDPAHGPFIGKGKCSSILDVASAYDIDIEHNCGGVCVCTTCHVVIVSGAEFLSPISSKEAKFLGRLPSLCGCKDARLACQAVPMSNDAVVVIEVPHRPGTRR